MRMIFFFKSSSRSVRQEEVEKEDEPKSLGKNEGTCTRLTVWRKSLIISCKGFTVINSSGDLVYRVDNYEGLSNELILMDGSGQSLLTMLRHKKLGMVESWLIYEGEVDQRNTARKSRQLQLLKKPIWCVRKHTNIFNLFRHGNVLAYVSRGFSLEAHSYVVEGSYIGRSCKVLDGSRRVVAEVKSKEAMISGVSFGVEVFVLIVHPGFDPGIAMAIVLLLDQMFS